MPGTRKEIIIIAGPNGAGKTTFAREYLPREAGLPVFVNADLIAAGLEPFRCSDYALRAGRMMLDEINAHARAGRSFAFETTLAGRAYSHRIAVWRACGYHIELLFLSLRTPETAIERVRRRVWHGGHDVPDPVVRRRFAMGLANFWNLYANRVDNWRLYDNTGPFPVLLDKKP